MVSPLKSPRFDHLHYTYSAAVAGGNAASSEDRICNSAWEEGVRISKHLTFWLDVIREW